MTLLVIRGADYDPIPFTLQSLHMVLIRPALHTSWGLACFEGVCDKFKSLVQKRTDLGIVFSDQSQISLFLVFCHRGLLKDGEL